MNTYDRESVFVTGLLCGLGWGFAIAFGIWLFCHSLPA